MSKYKGLKQGDIIRVDFAPVFGHEQAGYRPALVVSANAVNEKCGGMVTVCPISHTVKDFPYHVTLPADGKIQGAVFCEHMRALDLSTRDFKIVGHAPESVTKDVMACIGVEMK